MSMATPNKELPKSVDIKSENEIYIKHEPIESVYFEDGLSCSSEENQYLVSTPPCTENSASLGLNNTASVKTEDAHENTNEIDDQRRKIGLNFNNCEISETISLNVGNPKPSNEHEEEDEEMDEDDEGNSEKSLLSDGKNKKKYKCFCSYESNHKGNFEKHLLVHSDIKLFNCTECNYSSKQKSHLKRHLVTHTDIKLHRCLECNYSCNQKGDLKRHSLTHMDIKLFQCSDCHYECNDKRSLKRHMLRHSGRRNS